MSLERAPTKPYAKPYCVYDGTIAEWRDLVSYFESLPPTSGWCIEWLNASDDDLHNDRFSLLVFVALLVLRFTSSAVFLLIRLKMSLLVWTASLVQRSNLLQVFPSVTRKVGSVKVHSQLEV